MRKKGLSTIVSSVLIILLVIVAIGIVWAVLRPSILKSSEEIDSGLLTVNMKIEKATISGNLANVKILRQAGQGRVDKIRVVISNETSSEVRSVSGLQEMESRVYSIETSINNVSSISIAPILIKDGEEKTGLRADDYILRKITVTEASEIPSAPACLSGLVGYWKFNEELGTITYDALEINNGVLNNVAGLSWVGGKIGNALDIFGGFVDMGSNASLNIQGVLSLEAWIKPSGSRPMTGNYYYNLLTKNSIYSKGYGLSIHGYYPRLDFWIRDNSGNLRVASWYYGAHANIVDRWIYIASTYDGGAMRLYVNGTLISTTPNLINPGNTLEHSLRIGYTDNPHSNYDRVFYGALDNIAIYNKSLTQTEILEHYNSGIGKELC